MPKGMLPLVFLSPFYTFPDFSKIFQPNGKFWLQAYIFTVYYVTLCGYFDNKIIKLYKLLLQIYCFFAQKVV